MMISIILGVAFLLTLFLLGLLLIQAVSFTPAIPHSITYDGPPYSNCLDCNGTGVIMPGDEHFEVECPCRQVLHY